MKAKYREIKTEGEFEKVALRVEKLINAEPETVQAKELKLLTRMIVEYVAEQEREYVISGRL